MIVQLKVFCKVSWKIPSSFETSQRFKTAKLSNFYNTFFFAEIPSHLWQVVTKKGVS